MMTGKFRLTALAAGIFLSLLFSFPLRAEDAVYDPALTAPRCVTGQSPCAASPALINGCDNMVGGPEPNQPNTLSSSPCADGAAGTYHVNRSIDALVLTTPLGEPFSAGGTIVVSALVWCQHTATVLRVFAAESPASPNWVYQGQVACPSGGSAQWLNLSISPAFGPGTYAVRPGAQLYLDSNEPCVPTSFNDHDDLIIELDSDNDGLTDSGEMNTHLTDPLDPDSDDDGLTDGAEVNTHLTDPLDPDSDDDGLADGAEVNTHLTDPLDPDSDDDGLTDGAEVNIHLSNPLDPDSDDDGLTDGDEVNIYGTSPLLADTDGDTMPDEWEVSSGSTCGIDPLNGDSAADHDADGLSNLGEYIAGTGPCDPDSDDDGLTDEDEVNTHLTNPLDPDSDDDGLTDGDEVIIYGTSPLQEDTDGDGMTDEWEVLEGLACGLNPLAGDSSGDPDGDGLSNLSEFNLGTGPCDEDTDNDLMPDGWEADYACMSPLEPTILNNWVGVFDPPGLAVGVYVSGSYAYVVGLENGLHIIDVSNPADPVLAGTYNTPGDARDVYVSGSYAYVADDISGLQIINVSNPASPVLAGSYNTPGQAAGVYVSGSYAYVADSDYGLQVIDVSNPASPVLAGSYDTPGLARGVYVTGGHAYVADVASGLLIFDVSYPPTPILTGAYDTPDQAVGVFVSGPYAYVADNLSGLQIIDVSNPASPEYAGGYDTPGFVRNVYVSGGYAYVSDSPTGVRFIDVSNPASPVLADTFGMVGAPWEVFVSGSYAFVAQEHPGLFILGPTDADMDGLTDLEEYNAGTDPCDSDTDADWLSDYDEITVYFTNPLSADTDSDGLTDGQEVLTYSTDPLNPDTDGDGLADGLEVNTLDTDPLETGDADNDGLTDGEEVMIWGTNPFDPDTDNDGLSDYQEAVISNTNPWLIDSDGDGLADASEIWVTGTDPLDPDSDDDGVPDGEEGGSPITDNDGDNMPGAWEDLYDCVSSSAGDSTADPDGDSLTNSEEYNLGTNPCAADTDNDGINDNLETESDPSCPDTDGDGLQDGEEINTHSTDPANADSDSDGFADGAEIAAGSDPTDPGSIPPQPQHLINYQGRLADSAGTPINGPVNMTFSLFGALSGGTAMWTEAQTVTVTQGIYNVLLGSVTTFSDGIFDSQPLYLEVSVNGETLSPRALVSSAPMAIKAEGLMGGRFEMDTRALTVATPAANITVHISFNQAFLEPPKVTVSPLSGRIGGMIFLSATVENITNQGFDVTFASLSGQPASGQASFTYQAFGN